MFKVYTLPDPGTFRAVRAGLMVLGALILLVFFNPIAVIPAGHVGVLDFFGIVSSRVLSSGVHLVVPFTRVIKMTVQTQELQEHADVPSKEGLILDLEASLLFRLEPQKADDIYKTVGKNYASVVVEPSIRSAIREITASYEAKTLYSSERERVAQEMFSYFTKLTRERGIVAEAILLRKIGLPPVVANAIQEKLRREQEAEQMKFVLLKEEQEAERKRIEARGIADFQRIVAAGLSRPILEWKGIEATEKLAQSPNSKVVLIGNPKTGLPIILSSETR